MYADDHRPPHFHIVASDFQVLVRISDLTVIAGEARENQIAEALAWAKAHQEALRSNGLNSTKGANHAEENVTAHPCRDSGQEALDPAYSLEQW